MVTITSDWVFGISTSWIVFCPSLVMGSVDWLGRTGLDWSADPGELSELTGGTDEALDDVDVDELEDDVEVVLDEDELRDLRSFLLLLRMILWRKGE